MPRKCKCGQTRGVNSPQFAIQSKLVQIDGETAIVQFRSGVSFTYNGTPFNFTPSQIVRANYVHLYAALQVNNNAVHFINFTERADFIVKYPDVRTYSL
jgi:hypothetical protein